MTRNFKTLEVGKYYVRNKGSNKPVEIVKLHADGDFEGSDGRYYNADGSSSRGMVPNLTTEVTVTITPVEPKKPRECWLVINKDHLKSSCVFDDKEEAYSYCRYWSQSVFEKPILVREVMDGEE